MERSQELADAYTRTFNAMFQGSPSDQYLTASRDMVIIGTDPKEWISGRETVRQLFDAASQALVSSGAKHSVGSPLAWAEGDVGWVVDRPVYRSPGGAEVSARLTTIWHREGGAWKLVHQHASLGVPDEQVPAFA